MSAGMRRFRCVGVLLAMALLLGADGPAPEAQESYPYQAGSAALVIGVSRYREISKLRFAPIDAVRVAHGLLDHGFRVQLVTDEPYASVRARLPETLPEQIDPRIEHRVMELTAARLQELLRNFLVYEGSTRGAGLLIWFAGHGTTVQGEGFLLGSDAAAFDAEPQEQMLRGVQLRSVGSWMRLARAQHVLAVFDSCFAATVFEPRSQVRPIVSPRLMLSLPVRQFLTSGGFGERVLDNGRFASRFLDGIAGAADSNRDRHVTATELGLYLSLRTQRDSRFFQTPQYGELLDRRFDQGNFLFAVQEPGRQPDGGPEPPPEKPLVPVRFRDCDSCPELVRIPGLRSPDRQASADFAIGRFETTIAEWNACVEAGGCETILDATGRQRGRQPVVRATRAQAEDYVRWLTLRTGHVYRLPTSAEWRHAAAGPRDAGAHDLVDARRYWFGGTMQPGRAVCKGCSSPAAHGPQPVGSLGAQGGNGYGLHDVHGNVWEWVEDCAEQGPDGACRRGIVRGGSWANDAGYATLDSLAEVDADVRSTGVGYRVVRQLER